MNRRIRTWTVVSRTVVPRMVVSRTVVSRNGLIHAMDKLISAMLARRACALAGMEQNTKAVWHALPGCCQPAQQDVTTQCMHGNHHEPLAALCTLPVSRAARWAAMLSACPYHRRIHSASKHRPPLLGELLLALAFWPCIKGGYWAGLGRCDLPCPQGSVSTNVGRTRTFDMRHLGPTHAPPPNECPSPCLGRGMARPACTLWRWC